MNYKIKFFNGRNDKEDVTIEHKASRKGNTLKITATVTLSADSKKAKKILKEALKKQKSPIEVVIKEVDKDSRESLYEGLAPHYRITEDISDIISINDISDESDEYKDLLNLIDKRIKDDEE